MTLSHIMITGEMWKVYRDPQKTIDKLSLIVTG